jgi:hypothetical protein
VLKLTIKAYDFAMLISGSLVAAATIRFFKKWIRPTGLTIPEVFVKNVGLKDYS